jgi:Tat protein secretion system quality control protein TatD with DNase activity
MIIDAHTHIHPDPSGFGEKYNASVEYLINSLENSEVDKTIVLPIYPQISNKFVVDACKKYSDKNLKPEKLLYSKT